MWLSPAQNLSLLAVYTHITIFRHGEWDPQTNKLILGAILAGVVPAFLSTTVFGLGSGTWLQFAGVVFTIWGVFLGGVASSMTIYRLFLHKTRLFPGPFLARWTGWYWSYLYARKLHLYDEMMALHARYGDYVRIGPNTISLSLDPRGMQAIFGHNTSCIKSSFHDFALPKVLLNTERSKAKHSARRKAWEPAFNVRALKSYEPIMNLHASQLMDRLKQVTRIVPVNQTDTGYINIATTMNDYAFNLMSHFAFSKTYEIPYADNSTSRDAASTNSDSNRRFVIETIHRGGAIVGFLALVPWVFRILRALPFLARNMVRFDNYGTHLVNERRAMKPEQPDVFGFLLEKFEQEESEALAAGRRGEIGQRERLQQLEADAMTIALAGTDTSAAALTAALYLLASHPEQIDRLRGELQELGFDPRTPDHTKLAGPVLRGIIEETLRICPPAPVTGLFRQTPEEGLMIGDTFVPGGVQVMVPIYVCQHDERYFVQAEEFIPERWGERRAELVKEGALFAPFSIVSPLHSHNRH